MVLSCTQLACCSLDVDDQASREMGILLGLHCTSEDTVPFFRTSAQDLDRHNRVVMT